jgi:hypothetical protein
MARKSDAITIHDPHQFHRARAALESEGLLSRFMDPSGSAEFATSGRHHPGWLWVDETRLDEAEQVLDDLGIPNSINARPIVDRSDPACPQCEATLDTSGPEQCPHCGSVFTWVEIGETATED